VQGTTRTAAADTTAAAKASVLAAAGADDVLKLGLAEHALVFSKFRRRVAIAVYGRK
jgi:hypothetical protein